MDKNKKNYKFKDVKSTILKRVVNSQENATKLDNIRFDAKSLECMADAIESMNDVGDPTEILAKFNELRELLNGKKEAKA